MIYDRETIAAYVDGELDLVAMKRVEKAIADNMELADLVHQEQALRAHLSGHFAPVLNEPLPDRLTALLSTNVASLDAHRAAKSPRWYQPSITQWSAMAASLVAGMMIGGTALNRDAGYVIDNGGQIVASGDLADALDSQLASTQGSNPTIRIGISFAAKDGGYCRTFESAPVDGIACTSGSAWSLKQTTAGDGASEYRQASAGALADAAATMMSGDPLDASGEAAAKKNGWR